MSYTGEKLLELEENEYIKTHYGPRYEVRCGIKFYRPLNWQEKMSMKLNSMKWRQILDSRPTRSLEELRELFSRKEG